MVFGIEVGKAFVSTCSVVMLEKLKDWLGAQRSPKPRPSGRLFASQIAQEMS
jgi:hypothetical protein